MGLEEAERPGSGLRGSPIITLILSQFSLSLISSSDMGGDGTASNLAYQEETGQAHNRAASSFPGWGTILGVAGLLELQRA